MGDTFNATAHGLPVSQVVKLGNLAGGDGLDENYPYYVLAAGHTANAFKLSLTDGGAPVSFTTDITAGVVSTDGAYTALTTGIMAPPTVPPTPTAPTVSSEVVGGLVRLVIALNSAAEVKVRAWEVDVTHEFEQGGVDEAPGTGDPEWTTPSVHTLPDGATGISLPAHGGVVYAVRVRAQDVYGNYGLYSTVVTHTTLAGPESLVAAVAALANAVSDGAITETSIQPGSISTPLLQAGAVTAEILASTIVLASLIKTAEAGRRIELDVDGIRLYDTDESLLVRVPTNGDPVYVSGEVSADSLVSQTAAQFSGDVSFEGSSASVLQNGVSSPTIAPTVTASVDVLTLTSTPTTSPVGIAYDSAAGTFWLAVDPASGYVAREYNATTGALVRSIEATGSTSTVTATLGSTTHVEDGANGRDGATDNHVATPLTIPGGLVNVKITKVAAYFAGRSGSAACRTAVWDDVSGDGRAIGYSASFTASSGGATTVGASDLYNKSMTLIPTVTSGSTYYFGFYHSSSGEGFQWDFDSGSGKTTYLGDDAANVDGEGWGSYSTTQKPNVYATYTHDVDNRLETAPMIGVATDGTHVYTLDNTGRIWKYLRSTLAYVTNSAVQTGIAGTKSKAGLFYDATAAELIITTTTGTSAGTRVRFVRVVPATLAVSTAFYDDTAGPTFSGTTDTFRGGARVLDPLNSNAATYWVATTNTVYAYTYATTVATNTANRNFGAGSTVRDGVTHDGTQFRGYYAANPTKVWKFSAWDWTSASSVYWFGYAWYDSNANGGTHETVIGPRNTLTMRRRERVQIQNPTIPTGGVDDPNNVRIYALPNASDPSAGSFKLQVTDALTARYMVTYASGGAADGAGDPFAAGTPATLASSATGFTLKGSGFVNRVGTSFPTGPATNDQFWRSDLGMEFFYDGTRWLSTQLFREAMVSGDTLQPFSATTPAAIHWGGGGANGPDYWIEDIHTAFLVGSGGSALSGSHMWVATLSNGISTALGTVATINSGSSNAWRAANVFTEDTVFDSSAHFQLRIAWTKTGTPGTLRVNTHVTYRQIAT